MLKNKTKTIKQTGSQRYMFGQSQVVGAAAVANGSVEFLLLLQRHDFI